LAERDGGKGAGPAAGNKVSRQCAGVTTEQMSRLPMISTRAFSLRPGFGLLAYGNARTD